MILNASLDAEFNILKQYVPLIEWTDFKNRIKSEKKSNHTDYCEIPHIFRIFFLIKIHWKNTLNASLNAEFNAVQLSVIR